MNVALYLRGNCTLSIPSDCRTEAMNLCMQMGLQYANFCWCEDGSIRFSCYISSAKRFLSVCKAKSITAEIIEYRGLPRLLKAMALRKGLIAGTFLSLTLIILSGLFVWDVQVSGNVTLTEEEVIEELRACGFGVGSYLPNLRVREIENRVLIASEHIGWISINIDGTVAHVQIIEQIAENAVGDENLTSMKPANLIAMCDGQIEYLELYRGNAVVTTGQAVKKGELLVSGLYDSLTGGIRFTRAAGRVMARTEHTIRVEIPFCYEEKVYEEPVLDSLEIHFFDFSKKIFKNSGNSNILCDIIKYNSNLGKLGDNRLPWSFSRIELHPYHFESKQRTTEEAIALCYEELSNKLALLSGDVQLLQKDIVTEVREDAVVLICTITCIENIAVVQEFEIVY